VKVDPTAPGMPLAHYQLTVFGVAATRTYHAKNVDHMDGGILILTMADDSKTAIFASDYELINRTT
jgi:hypothetical protein